MLASVPNVDDLHSSRKMFGHQTLNLDGSISQNHQLASMLLPTGECQLVEQLAKLLAFAASRNIVLLVCLIHKHAWHQLRALRPARGFKDRSHFVFLGDLGKLDRTDRDLLIGLFYRQFAKN
jgi:hypothetical protein